MLEGLKEALGYVVELGNGAVKTEVVEIAGKTYARSGLCGAGNGIHSDCTL